MQHRIYHQLFEKDMISSFPSQYRSVVAHNIVGIVEGRLICYEQAPTTIEQIFNIVVPISLRHTIFYLLHASPVVGRMDEYQTLYRIKL